MIPKQIFLMYPRGPAIVSTEPHLLIIYMQPSSVTPLQFMCRLGFIQSRIRIILYIEIKQIEAPEPKNRTVIRFQFHPPHIRSVPIFLRHYIRKIHIGNLGTIKSHMGSVFSVHIAYQQTSLNDTGNDIYTPTRAKGGREAPTLKQFDTVILPSEESRYDDS